MVNRKFLRKNKKQYFIVSCKRVTFLIFQNLKDKVRNFDESGIFKKSH